jgi:hypothetical protein
MAKNFLKNLTVPSPCPADWNAMTGNDQVRFCEHCSFDVHNLSLLTRSEAERLIASSNGRLCVQYIRDPSGRLVTVPAGQKLHRISRRVSQIAAGAFTAALSVSSAVAQASSGVQYGNPSPPLASQTIPRWALGASAIGTITDPNGAVIPGATVSLSNEEFNLALYASTDLHGQFRIDGLRAGSYNVRIEAPGFTADETSGMYFSENGETRVDRSLRVDAIEEVPEVEVSESRFVSGGGMVAFVSPEHPFVRAAQEDNLEALTNLIAGMNVNLRDKRSHTTALEHAVRNSNREMVQLLIAAGANVNLKDESDETALMMLDSDATSDLVWDLINAGARVSLKDNVGHTALMRAASANNLEAVKALIEAGAEVDARNNQGQTALMLAAAEGNVNVVRTLVLDGANINSLDAVKKNAMTYATENDRTPVIRFLKSKGAFETVAKVEDKNDQ